MKKLWTGSLCMIAITAILTGCFVIGDHLVNAQSADPAYTGDAQESNMVTMTNENSEAKIQPLSSDTEIRILIHTGPDGAVMGDPILLKVNGVERIYTPDSSGVVSLMVDLSNGFVLIEPTPVMYVEYNPTRIMIDPANVHSEYILTRMDLDTTEEGVGFTLVGKSEAENEAFAATQKVTLPKGETARLELTLPATYPDGTIYYGYSTTSDADGVANYEAYHGVLEISENTTICAYADETAVGGTESMRLCRVISFADDNNPENPGDDPVEKDDPNKDLTYKDEDDNIYTNDEVKLQIDAMDEYAEYEAVIKDFPEFKYITSDHVNFLDVKLLAGDVEVQPDGSYELILPYPSGAAAKDEFVLYQFVNGELEAYQNVNYTAEADGIHCVITNTGTFVIGWKETATDINESDHAKVDENKDEKLSNKANSGDTGGINTGDASNPMLWIMICTIEIIGGVFFFRKKRNAS